MSLAVLDGSTVTKFVENSEVFEKCVKECFESLNGVKNGELTRNVLRERFDRFFEMEDEVQPKEEIDRLYNNVFERFDEDRNGNIDSNEFGCLMKEIMLAMARGVGNSVVVVALEHDSLLNKAVQYESAAAPPATS
ncbi:putative Calcium-binding EF hand family protein [Melia azedarach]|uniref:Calcium-binding EF hand family protein n=1 Tax=Melia azedarach TaxID=155640 RepID=A0ACC1Y842_MELAZ|nr:putative Calcium-binding EF hand family protein [Melia azedarach]